MLFFSYFSSSVHLFYFVSDVGYSAMDKPGFVNNVLNLYFVEYFRRAAKLGEELRSVGFSNYFKYTTHPWLVAMFIDCPQNFVLSGIKLKVMSNPFCPCVLLGFLIIIIKNGIQFNWLQKFDWFKNNYSQSKMGAVACAWLAFCMLTFTKKKISFQDTCPSLHIASQMFFDLTN